MFGSREATTVTRGVVTLIAHSFCYADRDEFSTSPLEHTELGLTWDFGIVLVDVSSSFSNQQGLPSLAIPVSPCASQLASYLSIYPSIYLAIFLSSELAEFPTSFLASDGAPATAMASRQ